MINLSMIKDKSVKFFKGLFDFGTDLDSFTMMASQISLVVANALYFPWAFMMKWVTPNAYEAGRVYPLIFCLGMIFIVRRVSPTSFFYKKFHYFCLLGYMSMLGQFGFLVYMNNSDVFHIISYMIILMIGTMFMTHAYQLLIFGAYSFLLGIFLTRIQMTNLLAFECQSLILTVIFIGTAVCLVKVKLIDQKNTALEEEKRAKNKLYATSKMTLLGELASGLGHEINNPLMIISNELEIIDLMKTNNEMDPLLRKVEQQVYRIGRITNILKGFMDTGKSIKSSFLVEESVRDSVQLMEHRIKQDKIEVEINVAPQQVFSMAPEIGQILVNVLSNAIDAVSAQTTEKKIWIESESDGLFVLLRVIDNGHGILEANKGKIFVPFFTTKDPDKGTGIGLTIAEQLASKNDCQLYLEANTRGTCFCLKIPKSEQAVLSTATAS